MTIFTTGTVTGITDTGGSVYTSIGIQTNGNVHVYVWSTTGTGSKASTSTTVSFSGLGASPGVSLAEYSGGQAALGSNALANGNSANPSLSFTLSAANNWFIAGLGSSNCCAPPTVQNGHLREDDFPNFESLLMDNSAATAVSVTNSVTEGSANWGAVGVELKAFIPPPSFPSDLLWVKSLAAIVMIGFLILPAYRWKNHQGGAGNAPSFVELAVDTVIVCGAFLVIIGAL